MLQSLRLSACSAARGAAVKCRGAISAVPPFARPLSVALPLRSAKEGAAAGGAASTDPNGSGGTRGAAAAPPVAAQSISLRNLQPAAGSSTPKRRKGRGHASGMGKYAGRGMKGMKSRAGGGVKPTFEGGQTPLHRRTPKIGYMPAMLQNPMEPVNLDRLQLWIDTGRIDPRQPITMKVLVESGLLTKVKHGVKLLGRGAADGRFAARNLCIEVTQASTSAIAAVEAAGGSVKAVYYTRVALRALLKAPAKFDLPIKSPAPPPALMGYYTSFERRGYLSPEVQLRELKARLAAGVPLPKAAQLLPVYAGGPVEVAVKAGLAPATAAKADAPLPPPAA